MMNPRKVYCIDNGFAKANSVSFSSDSGRMLENCVFLLLRWKNRNVFYDHLEQESSDLQGGDELRNA